MFVTSSRWLMEGGLRIHQSQLLLLLSTPPVATTTTTTTADANSNSTSGSRPGVYTQSTFA
jgi:hypothetical protein